MKPEICSLPLLSSFFSVCPSVLQTQPAERQHQAPPLRSEEEQEEESANLIRPQKPINPLTASKSHKALHKELQMTHKRLDRHRANDWHTQFSFSVRINHKVGLVFLTGECQEKKRVNFRGLWRRENGNRRGRRAGIRKRQRTDPHFIKSCWKGIRGSRRFAWARSIFITSFTKEIWLTNAHSCLREI